MNSFFKGLTRGLLAVIPICLIVCVLFAGQRLILTDRTSVSSRNAGFDVDSVSAEQTVSDKRSSEDTALSPSDISAGGSRISHGGTSQNAFRSDDTTISIDSGNTAISNDRSKSDNIRNSDEHHSGAGSLFRRRYAFYGKHPVPLPSAGHFLHVQ